MELNNDRAVFRSKFLLDQDLAARSVDRALIYQDLGFEQLSLVEGWKAVSSSHGDFSAHRFLADSYIARPRHEIARVSELLQSQLLQPININPVQPRLSESRLSFMDTLGVGATALNEYNPLFFRNQVRLQANGLTAENDTSGYEAIVSGIYNRLSYSLGRSHFETDGFHENNGLNQDRYNAFVQGALSYSSSMQMEISRNDTKEGDILRFDPENFLNTLGFENDVKRIRFGLRHAFSNSSKVIASIIRQDRNFDSTTQVPPIGAFLTETDTDGYSTEIRHLFSGEHIDIDSGLGYTDVDRETQVTRFGLPDPKTNGDIKSYNAYIYSNIPLSKHFTATAGLSADKYDNSDGADYQANPKLGFLWNITDTTTLRGAAFRVFERALINDQTIEPTQIAGFNQFFDNLPRTDSKTYGLAIDHRFSSVLYGGVEVTKRELDIKSITVDNPPNTIKTDWDEKQAHIYTYWAPVTWASLSANYNYEDQDRGNDFTAGAGFSEVTTHRFPLGINLFFAPAVTARLVTTYVNQDGDFIDIRDRDNISSDNDKFWVTDTSVDFRLPKRHGFISVGALNLLDESIKFQDTDPANPSIAPDRTAYARINIIF